MTSPTLDPHHPQHPSYALGREASDWLVCLMEPETDPSHPYFDPQTRDQAFLEWLRRSPAHVKMYLETYEVYQRMGSIDPQKRLKIEELLAQRDADVIQLFGPAPPTTYPGRRRWVGIGVAAALALFAFSALLSWKMWGAHEYATGVGEQRTCKLDDGSFIYLNTDSRVKVDFSRQERHIDLIRGEALFAVEHDAQRPFIVTASGARIRAVGTQFNVRRRANSTEVTVVEGVVQVTTVGVPESSPAANAPHPTSSPSPVSGRGVGGEGAGSPSGSPSLMRLAAGEEASVANGQLNKQIHPNVAQALSWRERRLVFEDTPLAEVAAEFNRYNRHQIRVEGTITLELTGVFDADRPSALILYAMKQPSLDVQPDGDNWVIRPRQP
jgi:transmembrane sensor